MKKNQNNLGHHTKNSRSDETLDHLRTDTFIQDIMTVNSFERVPTIQTITFHT